MEPFISSDRIPRFRIRHVADARVSGRSSVDVLLRRLERAYIAVVSRASASIPACNNPLVQMGAIGNLAFVIALVTGILTLFWYSTSVFKAYDSVEAMGLSIWLAAPIRSLHRYSSDVAMLFAVVHGVQTLAQRKSAGPRWLAWVSGLILIGLFWLDGWTGYWLVWDDRAQLIAQATARFLDVLPIFPEPLMRSFLTDTSLNSLLFFLIFFVHMLVPLGVGVFLWLHIMRLNKSKFFPGPNLSLIVLVLLLAVSFLVPATSSARAVMSSIPSSVSLDIFYMLPLMVLNGVSISGVWIVTVVVTIVLFTIPWWLVRTRSGAAVVDEKACNGCRQCFQDCPFNAVELHPRSNGKAGDVFARVDPDRCVGCGICVGSCDSSGIDHPQLPLLSVRRFVNEEATDRFVAFICAESAGADLTIHPNGLCPELPGFLVIPVPCAGWVHMLTVERAIRKGATGVVVVGCGCDAVCRHGADWASDRLTGVRNPSLRREKLTGKRVAYIAYDRNNRHAFLEAAVQLASGAEESKKRRTPGSLSRCVGALGTTMVLTGAMLLGSRITMSLGEADGSELIVSFKLAGQTVESELNEAEDAAVPIHMRRPRVTSRERLPVRLTVRIDGEKRLARSYEAGGLFKDGMSIAIEHFVVRPGIHRVEVDLNSSDGDDGSERFTEDSLLFRPSYRKVVLFDRASGFSVN